MLQLLRTHCTVVVRCTSGEVSLSELILREYRRVFLGSLVFTPHTHFFQKFLSFDLLFCFVLSRHFVSDLKIVY